ncbi:DUF192 domain-containing protein [Haloarcula litorea]|uniref:DUF192 domain-containing protein n=1 Tax=Haloarcula litorea TaxID=3032579 RepID=UPI003AF32C6A
MRRALAAGIGFVAFLGVLLLAVQPSLWVGLVGVGDYDRGTVTVYENGTGAATATGTSPTEEATTVAAQSVDGKRLATVEVRIAATASQRYVGLSETASLAPDEGMLFVHDEVDSHAYVMRNMSFPLDIVFVDADGTVTTIHHAALPPAGTGNEDLRRYRGRGKYVLEVNRGWTNRTGVEVGDRVVVPEGVR